MTSSLRSLSFSPVRSPTLPTFHEKQPVTVKSSFTLLASYLKLTKAANLVYLTTALVCIYILLPNHVHEFRLSNTPTSNSSYSFSWFYSLERPSLPQSCGELSTIASTLPEYISIPIEDATRNIVLEGWEDEWFSRAAFNRMTNRPLKESTMDISVTWVNGSDTLFQEYMRPHELQSPLNDAEGKWLNRHGQNRYREWDQLRYTFRSIDKFIPRDVVDKVHLVVNEIPNSTLGKQVPSWMDEKTSGLSILTGDDFFEESKKVCLPTFNSLTLENQLWNVPSNTDVLFTMSDDMLFGRPHSASDFHSPLFGPTIPLVVRDGSEWAIRERPKSDIETLSGEIPFWIITSYLLGQRFGVRSRKVQAHLGHVLSRRVMKEAFASFPQYDMSSAARRFRNEPGHQIYAWFLTFHYTIERHREALLWSYLALRSDVDRNGYLSWSERQTILSEINDGLKREEQGIKRQNVYEWFSDRIGDAGLARPLTDPNITWTSLDGPYTMKYADCASFSAEKCLGPGSSSSDSTWNASIATSSLLKHISVDEPSCGDCMMRALLNRAPIGLDPLLPFDQQSREKVFKALKKYAFSVSLPNGKYVAVHDTHNIAVDLTNPYVKGHGAGSAVKEGEKPRRKVKAQFCLNDDVEATEEKEQVAIKKGMEEFLEGLLPERSRFEI